ncbi:MlaD family protein [Amycolatopsis thermoflava]|uniref:MlaD family protein n=1 Tax=Amycolatopsis thermoflava TaxID=84480 RepID=UPI003F4A48F7
MKPFALRSRIGHRRPVSAFKLGIVVLVATLLAGYALLEKDRVATALRSGDIIRVQFAQDYHLQPFVSQVKVAGVPVGVVSSVDRSGDGSALVELKVDDGVTGKLGAAPSAALRPTTILGGKYYVELVPGGGRTTFAGTIPVERTKTPVELQQVADALQPDAVKGMRSATQNVDDALRAGGTAAIESLLADAPDTLDAMTPVLQGLQGADPRTDLANVVRGFESTARVLTEKPGQLDSIVQNLQQVTSTLDHRRDDIAAAIAALPGALDNADDGLAHLGITLGKLRDTADTARPVARELDAFLAHSDPVLARTRPLLTDVRGLLTDVQPLVEQLVPTAQGATQVLDDVRGPVLDRVNGPIMNMVLSPFKGTGIYAGGGSDQPFYKEVGYMFATMDRASSLTDPNGTAVGLQPGLGGGSIAGTPINFEQLLTTLAHLQGATPENRSGR